jgi:polyhydroxyalkanoate synthase
MAAPGKRLQLVEKMARKAACFSSFAWHKRYSRPDARGHVNLATDRRFAGEAWQHWPFNFLYQGFLLQQQCGTMPSADSVRDETSRGD